MRIQDGYTLTERDRSSSLYSGRETRYYPNMRTSTVERLHGWLQKRFRDKPEMWICELDFEAFMRCAEVTRRTVANAKKFLMHNEDAFGWRFFTVTKGRSPRVLVMMLERARFDELPMVLNEHGQERNIKRHHLGERVDLERVAEIRAAAASASSECENVSVIGAKAADKKPNSAAGTCSGSANGPRRPEKKEVQTGVCTTVKGQAEPARFPDPSEIEGDPGHMEWLHPREWASLTAEEQRRWVALRERHREALRLEGRDARKMKFARRCYMEADKYRALHWDTCRVTLWEGYLVRCIRTCFESGIDQPKMISAYNQALQECHSMACDTGIHVCEGSLACHKMMRKLGFQPVDTSDGTHWHSVGKASVAYSPARSDSLAQSSAPKNKAHIERSTTKVAKSSDA